MNNPENKTHKLLGYFDDQTYRYSKKKKRTCQIVDFAAPADHRVKLKESEINN